MFYRHAIKLLLLALCCFCSTLFAATPSTIPILAYHNMDPVKKGSMTISTARFQEQMAYLKNNGFTVITLKEAVGYLQGKIASIPAKSVVITADDGRATVYKYMMPIVQKYHYPVTLFIFPGVISRAPWALTWEQLKALKNTGLFDIQDHTYSHPNFKQAKRHLSPTAFAKTLHDELVTSKNVLDQKLETHVTLLAWPFGIYNTEVENAAAKAGYTMAFSIDYRCATKSDKPMSVPRYMILQTQGMHLFKAMVQCQMQPHKHH